MILQGIAGELNEQQQNYLGYVRSAADELEKMVTDILDVAAIDAGQLELDPGDVDLKELASDAVELLASKAEHAGVRLAVNAPSGDAVITGDAKRLRQITVNLLSNALNHTPRDGRITLTVKRDEDGASITVADTGEGISPDRQARVFERFERGQRGGAGLGLALVKEIVEMHGGWVDLASAPEEGTTVVCHLPVIAKVASAPELDLTGLLRPAGQKAAADG
jgi:signal transduction histidine kinase